MQKKTTNKPKEPVKIRFKELANGSKSIYLDIYQNGKRIYEFLKLYIVPERTPIDKASNKSTLQMANVIKAQRILDITTSAKGVTPFDTGKKVLLCDWLEEYQKDRASKGARLGNVARSMTNYARRYNKSITLAQVDSHFILGFIGFLAENVGNTTQKSYLGTFTSALNVAVKKGILQSNPCDRISAEDKPKADESRREYLTKEELKRVMGAECSSAQVKGAFLFSCFCGLRISDIRQLRWQDITTTNGVTFATIVMQKTGHRHIAPLSAQALNYIPERGTAKDSDNVFSLPSCKVIQEKLSKMMKSCGISKHITFHCARHTFATLSLSSGVDIYTTSKLLGHANVATTQIYAKVVDERKTDAVNKINDFFNN